jgi:hypothetical protein
MSSRRSCSLRLVALRSFTLVEMLVAIAVLSLIMLVMLSMLELAGNAWSEGYSRIDNFTRARTMLDVITGDIQRGVFRPDLPAFGTGNTLATTNGVSVLENPSTDSTNAFFTRRAGVGTDMRNLSLVVYYLDSSTNAVLNRSYLSVPWTPTGNWSSVLPFGADLATTISSATPLDTAQGVVGFQLLFLRSDGSLNTNYTGYVSANPVVGITVGLAVVDGKTLQILNQENKLATLKNVMAGALTGTNSPKTDWDSTLNVSGFYQNYPTPLKVGLKTFERDVFCETPF